MATSKKKEEEAANTLGEVSVSLGGTEFVLRPSYKAISNIQQQLGRNCYQLAGETTRCSMLVDDMAVIIAEMMHAYGKANPEDPLISTYRGVSPERIAELIFESGEMNVMARLTIVLMGAVTGAYTASGERKAAVE